MSFAEHRYRAMTYWGNHIYLFYTQVRTDIFRIHDIGKILSFLHAIS